MGKATQFGRVPYANIAAGHIAKLNRSAIAVYLVVAAHVNGPGWTANPSLSRIAELAGVSRSTARRALRRLADRGLIQIAIGGGTANPNTYTLATKGVTHGDTVSTPKGVTKDDTVNRPKGCQNEGQRVSKSTPKGVTKDDTRIEEQRNRRSAPVELPETLDTSEFRGAWRDWGQHRQEIKHPLTQTSSRRQLKMLTGLGHDAAIVSINTAIERGWRGLFPPDRDKGTPPNQMADPNEIVGMDDELAKQLLAAPDPDA